MAGCVVMWGVLDGCRNCGKGVEKVLGPEVPKC